MKKLLQIFVLLVCVFWANRSFAQYPAATGSDEPCTATALTVNPAGDCTTTEFTSNVINGELTTTGTPDFTQSNNTGANPVMSPQFPACGATQYKPAPDVSSTGPTVDFWYTITVPASGNVVLRYLTIAITGSTTPTNLWDFIAYRLAGSCDPTGTLTEVPNSCEGTTSGGGGKVLTGLTPGETIYLRVWREANFGQATSGNARNMNLCVQDFDPTIQTCTPTASTEIPLGVVLTAPADNTPVTLGTTAATTTPTSTTTRNRASYATMTFTAGQTYQIGNCTSLGGTATLGSTLGTAITIATTAGVPITGIAQTHTPANANGLCFNFTPTTTGNYRVYFSDYPCATNTGTNRLRIQCTTCPNPTAAPTGCPTLSAPAANAVSVPLAGPITFTWSLGTTLNAQYYDLYLSAPGVSSGFTVAASFAVPLTTSIYTPTAPLQPLTDYYWYLVPRNGAGSSATCSTATIIRKFTTAPLPPPNDDPCNAAPLTVGAACSFNNAGSIKYNISGATHSASIPAPVGTNCNGFTAGTQRDAWFKMKVPASGNLGILSDSVGTLINYVAAVYSGTCTSMVRVDCNDTYTGNISSTLPGFGTTTFTPGDSIFLRIWASGTLSPGSIEVCAYEITRPANDKQCNATFVAPGTTCSYTPYPTTDATVSTVPAPISCTSFLATAPDIWFKTVVPPSGDLIIRADSVRTIPAPTYDYMMAAYKGTCNALTYITCDDNSMSTVAGGGALMPRLELQASAVGSGFVAGDSIFIRIVPKSATGVLGKIELCIFEPPKPINDICINSINIPVSPICTPIAGAVDKYATDEDDISDCVVGAPVQRTVWYKFTATSPTMTVEVNAGANMRPAAGIFSACGGLVVGPCQFSANLDQTLTFNLTGLSAGSTYFVQLYDTDGDVGSFTICAKPSAPPPANDDPCAAINLPLTNACSYTEYTNVDATTTLPAPTTPTCGTYAGGDVWFRVVVPASGRLNFDLDTVTTAAPRLIDGAIQLYKATAPTSCSTPASWSIITGGCNDDASTTDKMPILNIVSLTPNDTIFVRIYGKAGATGKFNLCVYEPVPPANDEPCAAQNLTAGTTCSYTPGTTYIASTTPAAGIPAPTCGLFANNDVWYTVTVPPSGLLEIDTKAGTLTNAAMQIYTGTATGSPCTSTMTAVVCNDNKGGTVDANMPKITISNQPAGTVLYVRIYPYNGILSGSFEICAREIPLVPGPCIPYNTTLYPSTTYPDTLTTNVPVTITTAAYKSEYSAVTLAAGKTYVIGNCTAIGGTNPTGNGTTISITNDPVGGASVQPTINYGFVNQLSGGACITFTPTVTAVYRVYRNEYPCAASTSTHTFRIQCSSCPPPPPPPCSTLGSPADASTTVAYATAATLSWTNNGFATGYDVYLSTSNPPVAGTIGTVTFPVTVSTTPYTIPAGTLAPSTTYYWQVIPKNANGSAAGCVIRSFTTVAPPPPNDDPCGAIPITMNNDGTCSIVTTGTTLNNTTTAVANYGYTNPVCGMLAASPRDMWYTVTTNATGDGSTALDIRLDPVTTTPTLGGGAVNFFTASGGTCPSFPTLTPVCGGVTAQSATLPLIYTATGLTPSTTYYIRINTYGSADTQGGFNLCLKAACAAPVAPVVVTPVTRCGPGTVDLTATCTASIINWYSDVARTTLVGTGSPFTTPSLTSTTTYYAVCETATGCKSPNATVVATVNVQPNLVITNPAAVCQGATVNLTLATITTGSTGGGIKSYWIDATATTPIPASAGTQTAITQSGTYYIKVATTTTPPCVDIKPVTVTINPLPIFTATASDVTCTAGASNEDGTLTISGSFNATDTYQYSFGTTFNSATAMPATAATVPTTTGGIIANALPNPTGTQNYTIRVFGAGGCFTDVTATMNNVNCAALCVQPTAPTNAIDGYTCEGQALAAPLSVDNPGTGLVIDWYDAATGGTLLLSGNANYTPNPLPNDTTTYYAQTRVLGVSPACVSATRTAVVLYVSPLPTLVITAPAAVCQPNKINLTDAAVTAGSDLLGGFLGYFTNAAATNVQVNPNAIANSGTYYIQAMSVDGCTKTLPVVVTINTTPTIAPTLTTYNICAGGTIPAGAGLGAACGSYAATMPINLPTAIAENTTSTAPTTIATFTMAALPAGAVISGGTLSINGITALGNSWTSDVRLGLSGTGINTAVTGAATASGTGTSSAAGLFNYTRAISAGVFNAAGGTVNILYYNLANDNTTSDEDAFPIGTNVGSLVVNYTLPGAAIQWFAASTGGTSIAAGTPYNPVGAAGSGLPDTNTPGTSTYYASCVIGTCEGPRAAVNFLVDAPVAGPTFADVTACQGSPVSALNFTPCGNDTVTFAYPNNLQSDGVNPRIQTLTYNIPPYATITSAKLKLGNIVSANGSLLNQIRIALSGAATLAATQISTTATGGTIAVYATPNLTLTGNSGSLTLTITETSDNGGAPVIDATFGTAVLEIIYNQPLTWYDAATGGTVLATGAASCNFMPANQPLPVGANNYYAQYTNAQGCQSTRTMWTANVTPNTSNALAATSTPNVQVCDNIIHGDDGNYTYTSTNCERIATVDDGAGGAVLGSTNGCVTVQSGAPMAGGQHYLPRSFNITPTNNGPATVTLFMLQSELDALVTSSALDNAANPLKYGAITPSSYANMCVYKYNAATGIPGPNNNNGAPTVIGAYPTGLTVSVVPGTSPVQYSVTFPVTGFSGFYCAPCNPLGQTLPVDLLSFVGRTANGINILDWATASELNNAKFEVERSTDGVNFEYIGAVKGNGTTNVRHDYKFADNQPVSGVNYYRLRQIDTDGKYKYSNTIQLTVKIDRLVIGTIVPNPTSGAMNYVVYAPEQVNATLSIRNVLGQVIYTNSASLKNGNNQIDFDATELAAGTYIIFVQDAKGRTAQRQFVKVN
jgi:hypothetical protein